MKSLVIVESPAKARTINKILGADFGVKASVGHIKDLPERELGVAVDKDFAAQYVVIPGKEKVIRELKSDSKKAEVIYIATDPDREGEAIAHHIAEEVGSPDGSKPVYRVTFHEITARAVRDAVANPGVIDTHKVEAQQARRILDRLVGYKLSPFLWRTVRRGLSAGRVQSVAVRLVVDREREIESFKKEEYWTVEVLLRGFPKNEPEGVTFRASLHKLDNALLIDRTAAEGKRFLIQDAERASRVVDGLRAKDYFLAAIDKKLKKRAPHPPFTTSTLQQEASRKLRFPAKKTMSVAQQLYEGVELGPEGSAGLITYMRTDSFRVAPEAQSWARDLIASRFGKEFLPEKPPVYKARGAAQEAHEAIRPTYPDKAPEAVKAFLSKDQYNLYSLVWNRFIASQMSPAQLEQTTFVVGVKDGGSEVKGTEFRATGTVIRFPGFMALYTESKDEIEEDEGGILPRLSEGSLLKAEKMHPSQHFTQPPPRYTEATLVKTLEEKGIGRPSTYASILSTIQDREYVAKEEGRFKPTELGTVVNDLLVEKFPELIDIGFTARMEEELDGIENAKMKWMKVVKRFYAPFARDLDEASKEGGRVKPEDIATEETCEKCGKPLVIRWGRHGRFMACTGFPRCRNARPLNGEAGPAAGETVPTEEVCGKCGKPMVIRSGRYGKFMACSTYPACKHTKPLPTGVKCPLDSGDIVERTSKRGRPFWSCSNYPNCTFSLWYRPLQKACPKCGAPFLVEQRNKAGEVFHVCAGKGCTYKENQAGPNPDLRREG